MKRWICFLLAATILFMTPANIFARSGGYSVMSEEEWQAYEKQWQTKIETLLLSETELAELTAYWEYKKRSHEIEWKEAQRQELDTAVREMLSKDYYAGIYYDKDDVMHIIPLNGEMEKAALQDALLEIGKCMAMADSIVIEEEPGMYSLQELLDAETRILEKWFALDIEMECIQEEKNTIEVYAAKEWTEDQKEKIVMTAGIDDGHISFLLCNRIEAEKME